MTQCLLVGSCWLSGFCLHHTLLLLREKNLQVQVIVFFALLLVVGHITAAYWHLTVFCLWMKLTRRHHQSQWTIMKCFFFSFIVVNNELQSVSVSSLSVLLTNPVTVIYSDLPNVLYTGWHAEVTKQHQAYGERAGLGEAEEVYWRFWSRRLIISLYSKIGLYLTTIFTLSYASDHLIRLFNCCVKNGGKCHRFNGPEVAANQSYSWQKNIYPFVTIIDLFFFFLNQPTSWGIASFSHINLSIHRGLCLRYFFKGFSYYISKLKRFFFSETASLLEKYVQRLQWVDPGIFPSLHTLCSLRQILILWLTELVLWLTFNRNLCNEVCEHWQSFFHYIQIINGIQKDLLGFKLM